MSANLCLIAWNEPIGTPNCSRCFAYSSVTSKIVCAVPTHLERERDRRFLDARAAAPGRATAPGRRARGRAATRTPSRRDVREAAAAVERVGRACDRGAPTGTTTARTPSSPAARASRATTTISSTASPSTTQRFVARRARRRRRRLVTVADVRPGRTIPSGSDDRERAGSSPGRDGAEEARLLLGACRTRGRRERTA